MYNSQYYTCEQIDQRLLQGYLDDYNTQTGQSLTKAQFLTKLGNIFSKEGVIDNTATQIGYYECDTAAGTAAKAITVANYALFAGGSMKVKFINKNTANNATLNINNKGAKALYYQGERASSTNSWDEGEVVEIYYDGTSYYANNIKGGSGSGVYDVSKEHPTSGPNGDGKFTLEYILNSSNVNELIPVNKREPGMTIQFVSTSDNKYVQYRLMSDTFNTTVTNWQKQGAEVTVSQNTETKAKSINIGGKSTALFNVQCITNISGHYLKSANGTIAENSQFDVSGFIKVNPNDIISVTGYGGNGDVGNVVGYDANQNFVTTLLHGIMPLAYNNEYVVIPSNVSYIRVCIANSTNPRYVEDDIHFAIIDAENINNGYTFVGIADNTTIPVVKPYIYYIAYKDGTYTNFGETFDLPIGAYAIIKYNTGWIVEIISLSDNIGQQLDFSIKGRAMTVNGTFPTHLESDVTPQISVNAGDILIVEGYTGSSNQWATCIGINQDNQPVILIPGFDSQTKIASVIIPTGIQNIIVNAANNLHPQYVKRFATLIRKSNPNDRRGNIVTQLPYNAILVNGDLQDSQTFNTSDFIKVSENDIVVYSGYCGNETVSAVFGYDSNKFKVSALLEGGYCGFVNAPVIIPSGIDYIRVCVANTNHERYIPSSISIQTNLSRIIELEKQVSFDVIENIVITQYGKTYWTESGELFVGKYLLYLPQLISVQIATEQSGSSVIRALTFINIGNGFYEFYITNNDIDDGAHYLRLHKIDDSPITNAALQCVSATLTNKQVIEGLAQKISFLPNLKGKNIAIIGDSISTHGNKGENPNAVEITIATEDVGQTLSAYVTKADVNAGLTLGGTTFTTNDIGTEVTFVPTSEDVGKVIGLPKTYNANTLNVWWTYVRDFFGCNIIPVCWSGSGLTRNRTDSDDFKASYAWHESQIRKCGIRTPGTMDRTAPDVIIITRGGNDFSHSPYAMLTDGYFDNYNIQYPDTDLRQDGEYGFKEAYFMTIGKLREVYPFAKIILCTFPVMKRINYSHFPMNNGYYSEPQYNNAVREIANFCGCDVIEFDKCGITFENMYPTYISDSAKTPTHPNAKGHEVMGKCAIKSLEQMDFTK